MRIESPDMPATTVVHKLQEHGKVPIDFLTMMTGRNRNEIDAILAYLLKGGNVILDDKDNVALIQNA